MKRLYVLASVILGVFLSMGVALAEDPATPDPNQGFFNLIIGTNVAHWLAVSLGVMIFIAGLKNIPAIADIFVRWPKAAVIVNAAVALLTGLGMCVGSGGQKEGFGFLNCILAAVGIFVGAAGWHFVKKSLSPPPREVISGSASDSAVAAAPVKRYEP